MPKMSPRGIAIALEAKLLFRRSVQPFLSQWEWQHDGSCLTEDSEIFFFSDGERGEFRKRHELKAKEICASCTVISDCRAFALEVREPYGIWGGLSEEDRITIYDFLDRKAKVH